MRCRCFLCVFVVAFFAVIAWSLFWCECAQRELYSPTFLWCLLLYWQWVTQFSRSDIDIECRIFEWNWYTPIWYIYLLSNLDGVCVRAWACVEAHTHSHFDMGIGVIYVMLITVYSNIISNWSFIIQINKSETQIWTLFACWLL